MNAPKPLHAPLLLLAALAACTSVAAPPRAPEQRARSADGVSIAYEELGQGSPTLVFVHGWCGERAFWRSTMEAFAPHHRAIALDLAGHGASGAERAEWTLASLARDVVAVVEACQAEDVILVGHSMGAPVALLAAEELAPRVRAVIGVDGLHRADFTYPPGYLEQSARELEADFPGALRASLRAALPASAGAELFEWVRSRALRTDRRAAVAILRGLEGFELAPALSAAAVPVRVIDAAAREPATDVEQNRRLADFDAVELEGVGHFPMLERPAEFCALLERWIEDVSAPAATETPTETGAR